MAVIRCAFMQEIIPGGHDVVQDISNANCNETRELSHLETGRLGDRVSNWILAGCLCL